jgi:hypothetical protein
LAARGKRKEERGKRKERVFSRKEELVRPILPGRSDRRRRKLTQEAKDQERAPA